VFFILHNLRQHLSCGVISNMTNNFVPNKVLAIFNTILYKLVLFTSVIKEPERNKNKNNNLQECIKLIWRDSKKKTKQKNISLKYPEKKKSHFLQQLFSRTSVFNMGGNNNKCFLKTEY